MKTTKYAKILISLIIIFLNLNANAGGLDGFLKFAQKGGSMTSVNSGAIIEDQKSGYYTGGSIISRGPRPQALQPLVVQMPSLEFDACTGSFDLQWGGFSHIKSAQLVEYFKGVASSAAPYVAKLAVKQVCPQCEDIMSDLENIARDINGTTFGQCDQGKAIAEGVMNRYNAAKNQKCLIKSGVKKAAEDLAEATKDCQQNADKHGEAGDADQLKSMLPDNYNLVWKALSQGDSSAPNGMKELMMSITGSIIGEKIGDQASIRALPSLLESEDLLERYIGKPGMGTATVKLYVCDDTDKCIHPIVKDTDLTGQDDTLYGKVKTNILSIIEKISINRGVLADEEQALIEFSQIPLVSLFEIELALKGKESVVSLAGDAEFIEVVCYDMVSNFMEKMLFKAKAAVEELKTSQIDNTPIERFNKNIEQVQELLRDKRFGAMKKLQTILSVKERLTQQRQVFKLGFTRIIE